MGLLPEKLATLVIGPESAGTRVVTQAFLACGFAGDGDHRQRLDKLLNRDWFEPEKILAFGPRIVYRQSLPHSFVWPDLGRIMKRMKACGYYTILAMVDREDKYMIASQLRVGHVLGQPQAEHNIARARKLMVTFSFSTIWADESIFIKYELLTKPGWLSSTLQHRFGLALPDTFEIYNGNKKYENSDSRT